MGRGLDDQAPFGGLSYLSSSVPMARTAPQAKNSTISAVSTMLARNRFNIRHLRKLALRQALTTDLATGRRHTHLQVLISNSAASKANARSKTLGGDGNRFRFYWALQLLTGPLTGFGP